MESRVGKGMEVQRAGGIGFILANSLANGDELAADAHLLPATPVTYQNGLKIMGYINSTKVPTVYIVPGKTVLGIKPAPFMAAFSSRGPSLITPDILKPDITAPGHNILAAWSEASSPTKIESDKRVAKYNIMSGTSMSFGVLWLFQQLMDRLVYVVGWNPYRSESYGCFSSLVSYYMSLVGYCLL